MDRPLDVPREVSNENFAVKANEDHLLCRDLIESECGRLHPDTAPFRIPSRHVAPYVVVMAIGAEDPAAQGNQLAKLVQSDQDPGEEVGQRLVVIQGKNV